jgi:hypothetical protein
MNTAQDNRCEASLAWEEVSGKPVVRHCGRPGKLYKKYLLPFGVILCEDCARVIELKHGK